MTKHPGVEDSLAAKKLCEVPRHQRVDWALCKLREAGEEAPTIDQAFDYLVSAYEGEYA